MVQWKQIQLVSMKMQVQSLALLGGSGIWPCHELWCSSQMWLVQLVSCIVWLSRVEPWEFVTIKDKRQKIQKKKKKKKDFHLQVGSNPTVLDFDLWV